MGAVQTPKTAATLSHSVIEICQVGKEIVELLMSAP